GLLTRIIPATVMPRNTSSDSMRVVEAGAPRRPPPFVLAVSSARASSSSTFVVLYSPTVVLIPSPPQTLCDLWRLLQRPLRLRESYLTAEVAGVVAGGREGLCVCVSRAFIILSALA